MTAVDILAIGAHPDDIELGCGATLYLAAQRGEKIVAADLTRGEMATRGSPEQRQREAQTACEILGISERVNLGLPDTAVGSEPNHLRAVVRLIRETQPALVLAPWVEDRHPDHAATGKLVERAMFFSGVKNYVELPPHRPGALYHYMLHHPFEPSLIVDVSEAWEIKQQALAAYSSQFGRGDTESATVGAQGDQQAFASATAISQPEFLRAMQARDVWMGALIGARYGEGFFSRGPLGLDRLPHAGKPVSYKVY